MYIDQTVNRIKTVGHIDGYVEMMLNSANKHINTIANQFGRDVKIAQRGSRVLVNSGNITSTFDYKKMESGAEFSKNIVDNLIKNQQAQEKGLGKVLNTMA